MEPPGVETGVEFPKNPLLCPICHDYFTEPCILSCYHTFCARCLRGREQDRRLVCPFCRSCIAACDEPQLSNNTSSEDEDDVKPLSELIDIKPDKTPLRNARIPKKKQVEKPEKKRRKTVNIFNCNMCDSVFELVSKFIDHCRDSHNLDPKDIKPYVCKLCDKRFLRSCNLIKHMIYHEGNRSHMCSFCGKGFITKCDLKIHEMVHENKRSNKCDVCGKCFNTYKDVRQPTMLKDGSSLPPPDLLMRQLIDIANSENPPCSNCDKRDRANMYYCNTCGQALCVMCRDNTHRAKMFSMHEIVHMTKCMKEPKKCMQHAEPYIMFSPVQNMMLCVNCFRDLPADMRSQCLDIDTAHNQASKRLERGQNAIMDLQTSVRDSIIALKGLMDELRRNMDSEKHTINTFCQGMQEAMAKTHAAMIMEVQRQYESKERVYKSQLLVLGTVMPVLQLHLVLCTTFTAAANKYQFLELSPSLIDRLSAVSQLSQPVRSLQSSNIKTNYRSEFAQSLEPWIGPAAVSQHQSELAASSTKIYESEAPTAKKHQTVLKNKILEGDNSFSSHCRSFESQIRELNQKFNNVKEKVSDLHKDIMALRKAQTPPLITRYELLSRECLHLDQTLERQHQDLDRMAKMFDQSWQEQYLRLRVEQEVFSYQIADINTLRTELKHLTQVATQLEPYIRSLTPSQLATQTEKSANEQAEHLASLLQHIGILQQSEALGKIPRSRSRVLGQLLEKVRPNIQERERSKSAGQSEKPLSTPQKPKKLGSTQQMSIDRLEAHIKEKLHDMMCRRQSSQPSSKSDTELKDDRKLSKTDLDAIGKIGTKQRIMYKKIGKSCDKINASSKSDGETKKGKSESDYQRIADATSQNVKGLLHESKSSPSSPKCKNKMKLQQRQKKPKVYPYSDGEDNVFYSMNDSADSLSTSSRRSSYDGQDKTFVVVVSKKSNKNMTLAQKQRSWETFPPKRRNHMCQKLSAPMPLKKADSFEGHEEAVKSLVAAVQETRRKPKGGN